MRLSLRIVLLATLATSEASAITREEVLTRARAYSVHRWSSTAANQKATCSAAYQSLFPAGDYVGVAYDWGGYMSLRTFDEQIAAGYGAGSQESDGILDLADGLKVGTPAAEVFAAEPVIDFEVTPNRPDWLGVAGIARDLAAAGVGELITPDVAPVPGGFPCPISIRLEAPELCPVFAGRDIRGVRN